MNNIIELENSKHENAYVGYQVDIVRFLKRELADNITQYKSEIEEIYSCVEKCVNVIANIERFAKTSDLIVVYNVLFEDMEWNHVEITAEQKEVLK